ncbi:MAG: accessory Sec system protein Asp3 [Lachnospiraceae bacterium]|nr:accessory Sec system protein Asp3 [Lachnospiraceae bacterium]
MILGSWRIYWNEYSAETYLYGAEVTIHNKEDVEYRNILMPPGTVIKQWFSATNYQMQKIEPALPIIDGESKYHIILNIDGVEEAIVRLVFLDRYGQEAGITIVRGNEMDFKCPLKTYSYKMQLINGGGSYFRFHYITIQEITDE